MAEGLQEIDRFDGLNSCTVTDDDASKLAGLFADVGVLTGPLSYVPVLFYGDHSMRFAFVVPNSTWLPSKWLDLAAQHTMLVTPSKWSRDIVANYVDSEVVLKMPWQHGVSKELERNEKAHIKLAQLYNDGSFNVLHMTSTDRQRKGTEELIQSWARLLEECSRARLTIVTDGATVGDLFELAKELRLSHAVRVRSRIDLVGKGLSSFLQRFHAICQPSRGEGFGMVPLEARCCGVPAIMTDCTGHSEHAFGPGINVVRTGDLMPIDDGPGAMAPNLRVHDLEDSLCSTYYQWEMLHDSLASSWLHLREEWTWESVTRRFFDEFG
jgi:glycosyltransferase involved in cell wall biosynthesis